MDISKKLNDAINAQIGHEFEATLQYLSMAAYFEEEGYKNLAKRMYEQAEEEHAHGMKFFKFVLERGGKVEIPTLPGPKAVFTSALEVFKAALAWEKVVTKNIYNLVEIAIADKDYATQQFLNWFTNEQIEEEANMEGYIKLAEKVGKDHEYLLEGHV
ncbi:MAG: ferritin [bacterium]|jgi:ferritin